VSVVTKPKIKKSPANDKGHILSEIAGVILHHKLKLTDMSTYNRFQLQFAQDFFASSTIGVLVQSCVGGIAAMAVLGNGTGIAQMIQLFIVVMAAIAYNGAILSQQKPRVACNLLLLSVGINTVIALLNFAFQV
jgi:hypothetical protein